MRLFVLTRYRCQKSHADTSVCRCASLEVYIPPDEQIFHSSNFSMKALNITSWFFFMFSVLKGN